MKIFSRIKSLFKKKEQGAVIVDRHEFAQEMKEKFKSNTALLKAIEDCMNSGVKKDQRVSLAD